ncbi:MAG: CinA family protein [Actinomycetota bacterium]
MSTRATEAIIALLRDRGETLAVAESLTGGGVGAAITAIAGASDVFVGGVIAYQPSTKESLLKVAHSLIETHTVVSEEVAVAMADGVREIFGTTWAIATTGVAGPGPADGHAAGTVWVAIRGPINQSTQLQIDGEREVVRNATVSSAITTFARILGSRTV